MEKNSKNLKKSVSEAYEEAIENEVCLCHSNDYSSIDLSFIPEKILRANQGCSSPLAFAKPHIHEGTAVLDLGCGAGLDIFIASSIVGKKGRAIGVDMTKAMIDLASSAKKTVADRLGYANTEFHLGDIEALPLGVGSVDVVISNCVINLSPDKKRVFSEIFRVLKTGGSFVIADIFSKADIPAQIRGDQALINKCLGGALVYDEFAELVGGLGFLDQSVLSEAPYDRVGETDFYSMVVHASK